LSQNDAFKEELGSEECGVGRIFCSGWSKKPGYTLQSFLRPQKRISAPIPCAETPPARLLKALPPHAGKLPYGNFPGRLSGLRLACGKPQACFLSYRPTLIYNRNKEIARLELYPLSVGLV
jgi:hypothetical protein